MQQISFQLNFKVSKGGHEKQAIVDEIIKVVGLHPKYGYKYWLSKVKGYSYGEILGILKSIENMDKKYPKGAVLTNKLKKR